MITEEVIREIYKTYKKPPKHREELNLPRYVDMLKPIYDTTYNDMEIVVGNIEEFSPFRRFLIRSLNAILEFDHIIAFVFQDHILFFDTEENKVSVNFKPDSKGSFFSRLFR